MTRLHSAAPVAKILRAVLGLGAVLAVVVVASGCVGGGQAPAPTPDPFAGLADRSDQAFRQGLEAYGEGQYRDALTLFEQAHTLSPSGDARIQQMIDRTRAAMAPTPTPVPPKPTEVVATPTATPVAMSSMTADDELGQRYFGHVTLAVVPGRDADAPAATQFFFQDQIGLHIEGLKQHLRLPFAMRVFNSDTGQLVADVQSDDSAAANAAPTPGMTGLAALGSTAAGRAPAATATANASPSPRAFKIARFWDSYVWFHQGGEEPGRYRLELYANGVLTNSFDYTVGTVPVPTPEVAQPAQPALDSSPHLPTIEDAPPPPPPPPAPAPVVRNPVPSQPRPAAPAAPSAPAPTATPQPTPIPSPTPIPTPSTAYTTQVGGVPAGLDVDADAGRFYLVDSSGVIWTSDSPTGQERPTLGTPWNIGPRSPVDLTVDQTTGYLYLSTRVCAPAAPGCILALDGRRGGALLRSISLPGAPTEVRVDSELGLLYVAVPERQTLVELDIHSGNQLRSIDGLPQITSMALDPIRHTLYAAHLGGQLTVIDVRTGQVTARPSLTSAGLVSVATARGLAYAVNTATHELAVVEPVSQAVIRYPLSQEPAAVAASEDTGVVYVLSSRSEVILQIDPTDGTELGRVLVASRSGHMGLSGAADLQTLRPRVVLNPANDGVYASLPEEGSLAAIKNEQFPLLARVIPFVDVPTEVVAQSIPGVVWPGGQPGPSQPAPSLYAQAPAPEQTPSDSDAEGI
jgi:hypothetical protein